MPSLNEPKRYTVSLTEDEIDALIVVVGHVRISAVNLSRVKQCADARQLLVEARDKIRRQS
jgi:hypothetical protein